MNLIAKLRHAILGKRIRDPVFGQIEFQTAPFITDDQTVRERHEYWYGRSCFAPLQREIGVIVIAGVSGPGEDQRDLFRAIELRWGDIAETARPHCIAGFKSWFGDYLLEGFSFDTPEGPDKLIHFTGIRIHTALRRAELGDFDLGYVVQREAVSETAPDPSHEFVIRFKDWSVIRAEFEG